MYTLYTDKIENFKCSIDVEGASLSETQARLVLESDKYNLLYEGTIDSSGKCSIDINKLKNILEEGTEGTMRLEVIADDTFFSPWEDTFTVKTNKKVTVEVQDKTPIRENKIKVTVNTPAKAEEKSIIKEENVHSEVVAKLLKAKGINKNNLEENINTTSRIVHNYVK